MLSKELRQRIRAMAEKYNKRRSNVIWALDRFPYQKPEYQKPRVRVKALSRPLANASVLVDNIIE